MSSILRRIFGGIEVYFGKEFRYYTLTFFLFLILNAILAPLFIILDIELLNNIEIVYVIGSSSALIYLVYMFLTMNRRIRHIFFQTKWKYLFGVVIPIGGTTGLSLLLIYLIEIIPDLLYYIVTYSLLGSFFIWLIVQLLTFGLFMKDVSLNLIERIEKNEKKNVRYILFAILCQVGMIIYLFSLRTGYLDITDAVNTYLFRIPFNLWLLPVIMTILSGILLLITIIRKKYQSSFFSTNYILFYNLYLLYHVIYLMIYTYDERGLFVSTINLLSLIIFAFTVFYALQSTGGNIKSRLEKWWQPISFFLFAMALLYITWSITFLHDLAERGQVPENFLQIIFWSINHLISYILGVGLVIVTVFIFLPKIPKNLHNKNI